jgi:hypothetical protein
LCRRSHFVRKSSCLFGFREANRSKNHTLFCRAAIRATFFFLFFFSLCDVSIRNQIPAMTSGTVRVNQEQQAAMAFFASAPADPDPAGDSWGPTADACLWIPGGLGSMGVLAVRGDNGLVVLKPASGNAPLEVAWLVERAMPRHIYLFISRCCWRLYVYGRSWFPCGIGTRGVQSFFFFFFFFFLFFLSCFLTLPG